MQNDLPYLHMHIYLICMLIWYINTNFHLTSEMELKHILLKDHVLDTLQRIGYNGVPARENKESIKRVVE